MTKGSGIHCRVTSTETTKVSVIYIADCKTTKSDVTKCAERVVRDDVDAPVSLTGVGSRIQTADNYIAVGQRRKLSSKRIGDVLDRSSLSAGIQRLYSLIVNTRGHVNPVACDHGLGRLGNSGPGGLGGKTVVGVITRLNGHVICGH